MKKIPELLAPAGSMESLAAAVANGADAIYLGGQSFNARMQAANFDKDALLAAREYTQRKGVKLYITLNTLLADSEMAEAVAFAYFLERYGFDAIILQDIGLAGVLAKELKTLQMHASTQMTIYDIAGAMALKKAGFSRLILAREATIDSIAGITAESGLETEVFIHGALCISYSGQCLMSSMIGGRSGNRGNCAQPCRMGYSLLGNDVDSVKRGCLLSTRDLCTAPVLDELLQSGVSSLKIEGRMKRPEYVAVVTSVYRKILDRIAGDEKQIILPEEMEKLTQIFNRDFTHGHAFMERDLAYMSFNRPNNRGKLIGRVTEYDEIHERCGIKLAADLNIGDGIEFWVTDGGRAGCSVDKIFLEQNEVEAATVGDDVFVWARGKMKPGDRVFKTNDVLLSKETAVGISTADDITQTVKMNFKAEKSSLPVLDVVTSFGESASAQGDAPATEAKSRPVTEADIVEKLSRLGDTAFKADEISVSIEDNIFLPVSMLNMMRRKAMGVIDDARYCDDEVRLKRAIALVGAEKQNPGMRSVGEKQNSRLNLRLNVIVRDAEQASEAAKSQCQIVSFNPWALDAAAMAEGLKIADICRLERKEFRVILPDIKGIVGLQQQKVILAPLYQAAESIYAQNIGDIELLLQLGDKPVRSGYRMNIFNSASVNTLQNMGIVGSVLSPELSLLEISNITAPAVYALECIVHGRMQLMVSDYCPVKSSDDNSLCAGHDGTCAGHQVNLLLKDEKGYRFPFIMDDECRMHLFNSRVMAMSARIDELMAAGISEYMLDSTLESAIGLSKLIELYAREVNMVADGRQWDYTITEERLRDFYPEGTTKGHYYRGVVGIGTK